MDRLRKKIRKDNFGGSVSEPILNHKMNQYRYYVKLYENFIASANMSGIYADDYIMIYKTGIIRDFFVFCRRQICSMQESFVMLQTDRSLIWMWTIRADVVNFSKFAGKN